MDIVSDAVIIGKNYSTSLGVIRALGQAGYYSQVLRPVSSKPRMLSPELRSRYVIGYGYARNNDETDILSVLTQKMASCDNKKVLIPTDDFCASLIDRNAGILKESFYIPEMGDASGVLTANMDKAVQKVMAEKSGILVASGKTVIIDDKRQFDIPENIDYPCYTKPQISIGSPKSYIKKCSDSNELNTLLHSIAMHGKNVILIEEYLKIDKEYVVPGVACHGKVIIPAFIEKTKVGRGKHNGVTSMGRIIPSEKMKDICDRLIQMMADTKYTGLFDIELIESKGNIYFNELNIRNGAAGYAITGAGVNLPQILLEYQKNQKIPVDNYSVKSGMTFVSEKVELAEYEQGFQTWKQYKDSIASANLTFIFNPQDIQPYRAFKRIVFKTKIHRLIARRK